MAQIEPQNDSGLIDRRRRSIALGSLLTPISDIVDHEYPSNPTPKLNASPKNSSISSIGCTLHSKPSSSSASRIPVLKTRSRISALECSSEPYSHSYLTRKPGETLPVEIARQSTVLPSPGSIAATTRLTVHQNGSARLLCPTLTTPATVGPSLLQLRAQPTLSLSREIETPSLTFVVESGNMENVRQRNIKTAAARVYDEHTAINRRIPPASYPASPISPIHSHQHGTPLTRKPAAVSPTGTGINTALNTTANTALSEPPTLTDSASRRMLRVTLARDVGATPGSKVKGQLVAEHPESSSPPSSFTLPLPTPMTSLKPYQKNLRRKLERVLIADADAKAKEDVRMEEALKKTRPRTRRRGGSMDMDVDVGAARPSMARSRAGSDTSLLGWFWQKDGDEGGEESEGSQTDDGCSEEQYQVETPPPSASPRNANTTAASRTHMHMHRRTQSGPVATLPPYPNQNRNPNLNPKLDNYRYPACQSHSSHHSQPQARHQPRPQSHSHSRRQAFPLVPLDTVHSVGELEEPIPGRGGVVVGHEEKHAEGHGEEYGSGNGNRKGGRGRGKIPTPPPTPPLVRRTISPTRTRSHTYAEPRSSGGEGSSAATTTQSSIAPTRVEIGASTSGTSESTRAGRIPVRSSSQTRLPAPIPPSSATYTSSHISSHISSHTSSHTPLYPGRPSGSSLQAQARVKLTNAHPPNPYTHTHTRSLSSGQGQGQHHSSTHPSPYTHTRSLSSGHTQGYVSIPKPEPKSKPSSSSLPFSSLPSSPLPRSTFSPPNSNFSSNANNFNAHTASVRCRQIDGYVSFAAVAGLREPDPEFGDGVEDAVKGNGIGKDMGRGWVGLGRLFGR